METELPVSAPRIDDLTYNYFKNGQQLRRELNRKVLSNTGVWADVAFLHQDRDLITDGWKPPRVTIARFKKINGIWKKQSGLNINNASRVDSIVSFLMESRNRIGVEDEEG